MTSIDFVAAQQRVAARQEQRSLQARSRLESQRGHRALGTLSGLPYPLGALAERGLQTWDSIKGREGTRPAFRVGQVDAELLDEELLELLRGQVGEALKYFGVWRHTSLDIYSYTYHFLQTHIRDDWSSEILLALRAILFKLSIWDHDASYGAALQDLRYIDARKAGPIHAPLTVSQKVIYGVVTVGGRYGWEKWEDWLIDREEGVRVLIQRSRYRGADSSQASRNLHLLSRISNMASTAHSMAAFASFLVFLVNGRYRTLLDRILRMRLVPPSHQISREVSFEYLNRQLVWHAFTEFLLFLLPLVGISRWRRWLSRAWRKAANLVRNGGEGEEISTRTGELAFLPERTCAICYKDQNPTTTSETEVMAVSGASGGVVGSAQTDITNPYETIPCGCIYCFMCIATRLEAEEGEGWVCLRCGEIVKECKPWSGDAVEGKAAHSDSKSVSFLGGDPQADKHSSLDNEESFNMAKRKSPDQSAGGLKTGWAQKELNSDTDVISS